jgi:2-dehydro-3-deoxygluconokinase
MQAAQSQGAVCSLDLNYRAKLWSSAGGLDRAQQTLRRIVSNVDALVGNEEDLQKGLGIAGPDVASKSSTLDPDTFFLMIDRVVEQFPRIKLVATTLREVHSTNRHDWAAVLWLNGARHVSPTCQLDVRDRIGGGDGFASGVIYGLISGRTPEEALRLGWAHGAFLTTYPGDVTMARLEEIEAFARGGSARVQR